MINIIILAIALLVRVWGFPVMAQPLALQLQVALNDKMQKDYHPYMLSLKLTLGEAFLETHAPFNERRRPCKWDDEWVECGYLGLSQASLLTMQQRQQVEKVVRDPCKHISFDTLKKKKLNYPRPQAPFAEWTTYGAYQRLESLSGLCSTGTFDATLVRVVAKDTGSKVAEGEADLKDPIGFEARIRIVENLNSQGEKK